jgi:hypothetical protein
MQIAYVVKDAKKWEVDPARTASDFDGAYYRMPLEKAWHLELRQPIKPDADVFGSYSSRFVRRRPSRVDEVQVIARQIKSPHIFRAPKSYYSACLVMVSTSQNIRIFHP